MQALSATVVALKAATANNGVVLNGRVHEFGTFTKIKSYRV
jgi:hypothetical protein